MTEVLYVSRDGEAVTTTLGDVDEVRLLQGLPVRPTRSQGAVTVIDVRSARFAADPKVAAAFGWTGRVFAAVGWRSAGEAGPVVVV